jgi:hypothetical protein
MLAMLALVVVQIGADQQHIADPTTTREDNRK